MLSKLKNLFSGGLVGLATSLADAFSSAFEAYGREQDRQAGRDQFNLKQRIEQDESKKRADKIYDRADSNRIKRMRDILRTKD